MKLKRSSLEKFKEIIQHDYGISLSDEEADRLGSSLLKVSKLAHVALARADDRVVSSVLEEMH